MSNLVSTLLALYVDRDSDDFINPEDNNRPSRYLEHLARVLAYRLVEDGIINRSPDVPFVDESTGRIAVPPADDPIMGVIYGRFFNMNSGMEQSGTATSGTTTSLVDPALTQVEDFWVDAYVLFTSGANNGQVRRVTNFGATVDRLEWAVPLLVAVGAGDTYVVTFYYISGLTNGAWNWVFGRPTGRTAREGVIEWIAKTTSDQTEGDILVARVDLSGAGVVRDTQTRPTGHDRNLWTGAGAVHELVLEGTVIALQGGAYVDITRSHDDLILFGPIQTELSRSDFSIEILDGWQTDVVSFRITNDGAYQADIDYTINRWGRRWVYL